MLRSQKMAITSLVLIFLFGIFCGIASERFIFDKFKRHGGKHKGQFEQKLTKRLELNNDQIANLKVLLKDVKRQHDEIRQADKPEFDSVRVDFDRKFNLILTKEQQDEFARMQTEWNQKRKDIEAHGVKEKKEKE